MLKVGNPLVQAKIFEAQSADELIFLDINSETKSKSILINIIQKVIKKYLFQLQLEGELIV